jgi:hypothetical protein
MFIGVLGPPRSLAPSFVQPCVCLDMFARSSNSSQLIEAELTQSVQDEEEKEDKELVAVCGGGFSAVIPNIASWQDIHPCAFSIPFNFQMPHHNQNVVANLILHANCIPNSLLRVLNNSHNHGDTDPQTAYTQPQPSTHCRNPVLQVRYALTLLPTSRQHPSQPRQCATFSYAQRAQGWCLTHV